MNREGDKYGNAKEKKEAGAIFLIQEPLVPGAARVMKRSKHIQQRAETQLAEKRKKLLKRS